MDYFYVYMALKKKIYFCVSLKKNKKNNSTWFWNIIKILISYLFNSKGQQEGGK